MLWVSELSCAWRQIMFHVKEGSRRCVAQELQFGSFVAGHYHIDHGEIAVVEVRCSF